MLTLEWSFWIDDNAGPLVRGEAIDVPPELGHPRDGGFEPLRIAEPVGQIGDWSASLPSGGRLHVHEFADGRLVAHLDRVDPGRGLLSAICHWLSETKTGCFVGAQAVGLGLGLVWGRWYAGRRR